VSDAEVDSATEEKRPRTAVRHAATFVAWNRDEAVWRDIYKNVVSAAIIALLAYLVALFLGYAKLHAGVVVLVYGVVAVATVVNVGTDRRWNRWLRWTERHGVRRYSWRYWALWPLGVILTIPVVSMVVVFIIPTWFFHVWLTHK
jgi:hypothetical protein